VSIPENVYGLFKAGMANFRRGADKLVRRRPRRYDRAMSYRNLLLGFVSYFAASVVALAADWQTDLSKALEKAKAENKFVLLDFTGSDWCGPCIELNNQALSRPEFLTYADKHLVLVEVDFPKKKKQSAELMKQNEQLYRQYGIDEKGYPTIVLLDPAGKIRAEFSGYSGENAADLIAWVEEKAKK
jgi:protein disulfide-isomerase